MIPITTIYPPVISSYQQPIHPPIISSYQQSIYPPTMPTTSPITMPSYVPTSWTAPTMAYRQPSHIRHLRKRSQIPIRRPQCPTRRHRQCRIHHPIRPPLIRHTQHIIHILRTPFSQQHPRWGTLFRSLSGEYLMTKKTGPYTFFSSYYGMRT